MEDVREVRLSGNTFGVEAAKAMAGALATLTNIEVRSTRKRGRAGLVGMPAEYRMAQFARACLSAPI